MRQQHLPLGGTLAELAAEFHDAEQLTADELALVCADKASIPLVSMREFARSIGRSNLKLYALALMAGARNGERIGPPLSDAAWLASNLARFGHGGV